jgi:transposase
MKANIKQIRKSRHFTEDFKKNLVHLFERGKFSVLQLSRLYSISDKSIYNWIYKYSNFNERGVRVIEMKESSINKLKELEKKVKELEQIVGQKQIKIDYLEKIIDIAKDDLNIDIKKNYNTLQSNGSEVTKKK